MAFEFYLYQVIAIIAIFNALLLAIFSILRGKGNLYANKISGIIYGIFGVLILNSLLLTYGLSPGLIIVFLLVSLLALVLGPLIFFYTKAYVISNWKIQKTDLLHFLPYVLFLSFLIITNYHFHNIILWRSNFRKLGSFFILMHLLTYLILALIIIKKSIGLGSFISDIRRLRTQNYFTFSLLAFIFLWIAKLHVFLVLDVWNRYGFCPYMYSIYFSSAFIFINSILFIQMKYPATGQRRFNTSFSGEKRRLYKQILDNALIEDKIYRNPEISLRILSEITGIPYTDLSFIINREYHLRFRDFINKHRIEDAMKMIANNPDKQKTFLEIAYEVGFNSKSTFNLAFKKYNGVSPREYYISEIKES